MKLIVLTILFPLIGYLLLSFSRGRISENLAATIGVSSIGLAAVTAFMLGLQLLSSGETHFTQELWTWVSIDKFQPKFSLRLDGLSLTMLGVVTGVGFLIHLFASWYMRGEEGYSRFFSYMNLFVASMLLLVLADDLVILYFGWEGVGLCSYLLIGFYYKKPANGAAAMKAFIVTRIGDVFLAIALFLLWQTVGSLNIQEILKAAPHVFEPKSMMVTLIALTLLGGAIGKSAQVPFHTWLADAMAGPTPVSALIHAATMVTAGVYLVARMHGIYELAPQAQNLVAWIGAVTSLMAGFAALAQRDIKRVLAYSTMSQLGYMFLALGVGAWHAGIFHLMTHAFFKALLFLSAGAVIVACHHEQDIFKLGGLRKELPLVYAAFIVGGSALVALPFVTAGFYSKDEILFSVLLADQPLLLAFGLLSALLTAVYTFRLIFIVFHGEPHTHAHVGHGVAYWLPLSILLVLSTMVGAWIHPPLEMVLPVVHVPHEAESSEWILESVSALIEIFGIGIAMALFLGRRELIKYVIDSNAFARTIHKLLYNAWGFDAIYDMIFVQSYIKLAHLLRHDVADQVLSLVPLAALKGNNILSATQTGGLRRYAAAVLFGILLLLTATLFLAA
ncbi:NADH-quinone oxidoreductase subunit L [Achromatium sp. WMS2]|nr:NADH-quinone oxidoreductase subunit L [Achromatium sp. WMS2]